MALKVVHLRGLNGIRAIASIAVVISHTTLALAAFGLDPFIFGSFANGTPKGLNLAGFGVSMFFTLSGFLITYLLLIEKESGDVSVKAFYIRRVLRIHPLYYSYLVIALLVTGIVARTEFSITSVALYVFLAANIAAVLNISIPLVAHYWSLGVEEQFYLFFPWIVKKISRLPFVFIGGAVLLTVIKIAFRFWDPTGLPFRIMDVTRFQCMLVGAAGAWFYYAGNAWFTKLTTNKVVQAASWGCLALITLNSFNVASILDQELVSGVTLCIIMGQVTNRNWFSLERPIFDFLGTISYGIYVIHPLIIFILARCFVWDMPRFVEYLVIYASAVGATVAVAYLSYRFFEKPFLKQKNRFSTVRSQPSRETATSASRWTTSS